MQSQNMMLMVVGWEMVRLGKLELSSVCVVDLGLSNSPGEQPIGL